MKCPSCGNQKYKRLDYAIVQCTSCLSVWDPYMYPGFPEPPVEVGEIWDTTPSMNTDWTDEEDENEEEVEDWDDEEEEDDEEKY